MQPSKESGQAAVEAALTLPLTLFMVVGALQLFLLFQARLMTEHAAFNAVREGSLSQGSCKRMLHTAIATLLPTFTRTDTANKFANAFKVRSGNKFVSGKDSGHDGDIVWIIRESPQRAWLQQRANDDDELWDDPDTKISRLEVRLIFWYPLRIPFANWVFARLALAHMGIQNYNRFDPLVVSKKTAGWSKDAGAYSLDANTYDGLPTSIRDGLVQRTDSPKGTYVFPLEATAAMRMMTPARIQFFNPQNCVTP